MYELPPILTGTSAQQLSALRAYLVRMAQQLNSVQDAPAAVYTSDAAAISRYASRGGAVQTVSAAAGEGDAAAVRKNAAELRQLIIRTADGLSSDIEMNNEAQRAYTDGQMASAQESFIARSEFGTFTENIERQIESTARGVVESYGYTESIKSNQEDIALLQAYTTDINGEIRRGLVTDPSTGEVVTGIAIAQNLQFTGEVSRGSDGMNYYTLSSGQTFGLYTATGWQFWINGYKRGWYNSVDGMLHIANVAVEEALQLGAEWRLSAENGLGIKYTGG